MTSMDIDSPSTPSTALTPVTPADNNEAPISEEQPNRRRRKKSIVWEHFTIETVGAGCMRACCKQCKKSFAYITGPKLAGTSHLKRHIALGICPVSRQKNEASSSPLTPGAKTDPPRKRYRSTPAYGVIPFDQDRCNQDIAKMIIQHEYPLHIVEHPAFIDFVRTLQPQYSMASFNTIQGECVAIYLREKQSLLNLISAIPGRVNLTLDLGTSNFDIGYAFLTGHFIDEDWNLQRRILSVVMLPFPDSDYAFNQAVISCLSDWHLESSLFSLTLDQSFSNESVMGNLRSLLPVKSQHLFNCQLLKGSCYARVLSRLAQDALRYMEEVIGRIRESVKYVKTSETHDEKFAELRQQLQVPSTKELIIDDPTKWNTTYQMLVAACELKEVFDLLDESDPVYKIKPSMNDWKQAEILCTHLKLLYDAASILTSPTYPPAYAFYHEVSKMQLELTRLAMSQDPFVSNLIRPLKEKFDQYWKDSFLILVIAVVMDPRFKMKFVEFSFQKNFGEDAGMWIKIVDDGIHELFLEYLAPNLSVTTFMGAEDMVIPQSEMLQDVGPHHQEADFHHHQLVQSVNEPTPEVHTQGATIQDVKPEKVSPDEPSQLLHHQEVAQQEIHSEHLSVQETSEQEMHIDYQLPLQDIDAQEVSPRETNTQDMPAPEAHVQGLSQETRVQEIPAQDVHSQAVPGDGIHAQELTAQDMHTEVGVQEVHHFEVVAQDMHSSEAHGQEMHSSGAQSQEMHNSGAHDHEMQCSGAHDQEMHTSEAQSQEIKTSDLETPNVQPPEAQTQEMQTCERQSAEPQTQEMNPPETMAQEMHSQEAKTQELQHQEAESQEMQPHEVKTHETHLLEEQSQEMHPHEVQNQEMHTQELETQEMHHQEVDTQEMRPQEQEVENQEMHTQELETQEMHHQEVDTQEMRPQEQEVDTQETHSQEVHDHEIQPQEVQTQDMHLQEVQTHEMQPQEVQTQEMQSEEHNQEMQHQEVHDQEIQQEEVQSQEMQQREVQTEEMQQELQTQEFQQEEVQTQEMQPQEVQTEEMQPQEVQTQEMQPQEPQAQEMNPQEVQTQEMQPQEVQMQEMQPQEVQMQEMQPQEVQTQEMQHEEVHNHEMQPQVQTQEMYHHDALTQEIQQEEVQSVGMQQGEVQTEAMQQEVQTQEFQQEEVQTQELHLHHQEIQAQEMHHQEVQTQQMHHQGFSQEMQPYEVNHQDLHLLSNIGDGYSDFEVYISATSNQHLKSELDQYLEESLLPRVHDFDVLGWWKLNKLKYPTLSKMAADILSIPISTVPPESVFDTGSKKIDNYQSSLRSVTLEALVCAKDWLQYGSSESSIQIPSAPLKIEY